MTKWLGKVKDAVTSRRSVEEDRRDDALIAELAHSAKQLRILRQALISRSTGNYPEDMIRGARPKDRL